MNPSRTVSRQSGAKQAMSDFDLAAFKAEEEARKRKEDAEYQADPSKFPDKFCPARRRAACATIDVATCDLWYSKTVLPDPYAHYTDPPGEVDQVGGDSWFVAGPDSDGPIEIADWVFTDAQMKILNERKLFLTLEINARIERWLRENGEADVGNSRNKICATF
jgi:hypothetical protein